MPILDRAAHESDRSFWRFSPTGSKLAPVGRKSGLSARLLGAFLVLGCTERLVVTEREAEVAPPPAEPTEPTQGLRPPTATLGVDSRGILSRCGEPLLLRGVSEMVVWSPSPDGDPEIPEIARTGANAVRVGWALTGTASQLERTLERVEEEGLIALVELHDGLGDFSILPSLVDYWTTPEILAVLERHRSSLLLEVGNGVGGEVPEDAWVDGWTEAIGRLRAAGLEVPLVIDAPNFGTDSARLAASGRLVLDSDPLRNSLLGLAVWWPDASETAIRNAFEEVRGRELPFLVVSFSTTNSNLCDPNSTDYEAVMREAARLGLSWFAWSWGSVKNLDCASFDMTTDGTIEGLNDFGFDVAFGSEFGIARTSRPVAETPEACP